MATPSSDLPYELILAIGRWIDSQSLGAFFRVCRSFYQLSQDQHFWRHRLWDDYPGYRMGLMEIPLEQSRNHYCCLNLEQWRQEAKSLIDDQPDDSDYRELLRQEEHLNHALEVIRSKKCQIKRDYEHAGYQLRARANRLTPFHDHETYFDVRISAEKLAVVEQSIPCDWENVIHIESYLQSDCSIALDGLGLEIRHLIGFSLIDSPVDAVPAILVYIVDTGRRTRWDYDYGTRSLPLELRIDMEHHHLTVDDIKRIYQLPFNPPSDAN